MFGIFDEREAAVFKAWVEAALAGERPGVEDQANTAGDERAAAWRDALARSAPAEVRWAEARHRATSGSCCTGWSTSSTSRTSCRWPSNARSVLHGGGGHVDARRAGRYTDASWFDYTPEALYERVERVYWDKLIEPYRPLAGIPDRDEVGFGQADLALGNMVDGTWAHRIGNVGRYRRRSDGLLFSIYVDEMGRGELHKNHLTLIYQALASMGFVLPHIREEAFRGQDQLSESHRQYESANHQLSMSLFPDTFYNEILGYNLGIEMYGLGEMRMNEIQRLRHHGFDTAYEEAHLTIDNFSAGHSRQAVDAIVTYLDDVRSDIGPSTVDGEWRRIWRGYASFAYFAEPQLMAELTGADAPSSSASAATDELVI